MDHYRPQINKHPGRHREQENEDLLRRIPSEDAIKQRFKMKIPVRIDAMENPISTIHVLEHTAPGIAIINDHARCIRRDLAVLRSEEAAIKQDYDTFTKQANDELDAMKSTIVSKFADFHHQLRVDAVDHQNSQVPMHKDIQKLRNDRNEIIADIGNQIDRVARVEDALFKRQIFDLDANDHTLMQPEVGILRREHAHLPDYQAIQSLAKSFDIANDRRRHMMNRFDV